jgi:hypothetical protein
MVGPIPLYLLDICALLTLCYSHSAKPSNFSHARKLRAALLAFACFIVAAQVANAVTGGWILVPAYMLLRYVLAVSVFISTMRLITSLPDLMLLSRSLALGLAITSLLIVLVALPPTRGVVTLYVFNNPMLEPVAEEGPLSFGDTERAQRGRSLVGTSTLSGGFINTLWPFALLLAASTSIPTRSKRLALFAAVLAPFGAVMTYARGALLGLGLTFLVFSTLAKGKATRYAIATVAIAVGVFYAIGWDSQLFLFERYERRFKAALESPYEKEDERERALAYTEPFAHLSEHPWFLLIGEGNSARRRAPVARTSYMKDQASHASFAWSYYGFGMIAAFCNVFLFAYATLTMFRAVRANANPLAPRGMAAMCLFGSLLGMTPWWVFGHGTVSDPRGMMLYMLVLGLVAAYPRNGELLPTGSHLKRQSQQPRNGDRPGGTCRRFRKLGPTAMVPISIPRRISLTVR